MPRNGAETAKTQTLYDRMADVQNLAMKLNGYKKSLAKYLDSLELSLGPDASVLDAGSGTGIVSMAFAESNLSARRHIALDLSYKSLEVSREEFGKKSETQKVRVVQGNVVKMPFADGRFDLVVTCGVLEYVPLADGLGEMARVLKPGSHLVLVPVRPSIVGSVLEMIYDFKIHPTAAIRGAAEPFFEVVKQEKFPLTEPIAWSKNVLLLRKR
jgi:ubiquinone/menaquinone biosynthesis C-methylase UbiE